MRSSILFLIFSVLTFLNVIGQNENPSWKNNSIERIYSQDEFLVNESLKYSSNPEVQAFIREVLAEDLPVGYKSPSYVSNATDPISAGEMIGVNYPEFFQKSGLDFLTAIKNNPALYIRMINEYKAVRLKFEQ